MLASRDYHLSKINKIKDNYLKHKDINDEQYLNLRNLYIKYRKENIINS